jgi:hypothetical protein
VIHHSLQELAQGCKSRISKRLSLLRVAPYCVPGAKVVSILPSYPRTIETPGEPDAMLTTYLSLGEIRLPGVQGPYQGLPFGHRKRQAVGFSLEARSVSGCMMRALQYVSMNAERSQPNFDAEEVDAK